MKLKVKKVLGREVETSDGVKGKITDIWFNEDDFSLQYLEADFGNFLTEEKISIPIANINLKKIKTRKVSVVQLNASYKQIISFQECGRAQTISRAYHERMLRQSITGYGMQDYHALSLLRNRRRTIRNITVPNFTEQDLGTKLRSAAELLTYKIRVSGNISGILWDMSMDTLRGRLDAYIIDRDIFPWTKKLIAKTGFTDAISFVKNAIELNHPEKMKVLG